MKAPDLHNEETDDSEETDRHYVNHAKSRMIVLPHDDET